MSTTINQAIQHSGIPILINASGTGLSALSFASQKDAAPIPATVICQKCTVPTGLNLHHHIQYHRVEPRPYNMKTFLTELD